MQLTVRITDAIRDQEQTTGLPIDKKEFAAAVFRSEDRSDASAAQRLSKIEKGKCRMSIEEAYRMSAELQMDIDSFLLSYTNIEAILKIQHTTNATGKHHRRVGSVRKRDQQKR